MLFWYTLVLAFLYVAFPPARYLLYTVSFLVILVALGDGEVRIGDEAKPFLAFCLAGVAFMPLARLEGVKDLFFVFCGISVALLIDIPNLKTWSVFWLNTLAMCLFFIFYGGLRSGFEFGLVESKSTFEGSAAFLFGLLVIVALLERRYWLMLLSALMAVVALKRIALLAALVAAMFIILGERRGRIILNPRVMILVNSLVLVASLLYGSGALDRPIKDLTGMSANQLGMGREELLSVPTNAMIDDPYRFLVFGAGPGGVYDHLVKFSGTTQIKQALHNDLVKITYEYGYIFFLIFVWLMYSCKDYRLRTLFLYLNILYMTDNTLIYSFFLVIFVTLARLVPERVSLATKMTGDGLARQGH